MARFLCLFSCEFNTLMCACVWCVQHEISLDAYNRLTSTPDAKGRNIEVIKVPIPYPLFRTYKEANGVHVSAPLPQPSLPPAFLWGTKPRFDVQQE